MLRGLIRCSCCGSILTTSEQGRSLQCPRYAKGRCPVSHHIRLEKLNRIVLSRLEEDLRQGLLPLHIRIRSRQQEADPLSQLIRQEERSLERVLAAYEAGIDSLDEYRSKKTRITNRIHALLEKRACSPSDDPADLPDRLTVTPDALFSLLSSDLMSEPAKNELLKSILSYITFYRQEDAIQICYRI